MKKIGIYLHCVLAAVLRIFSDLSIAIVAKKDGSDKDHWNRLHNTGCW